MWNEKLETRAADMRERAKMRRFLRLPDIPKIESSLRNQQYVSKRISDEARQLGLEKGQATTRAKGNVYRNTIVNIDTNNFQQDDKLRDPELRTSFPACPHCQNSRPENTIRAGFAHGIQRYRCQMCRRTFSGPTVVVRLEPFDYKMICYHCGSGKVKRLGKGISESRTGRLGHCQTCKRKFVQGGLHDLQKYHLLLETRIADKNLPTDVEAEVLQMASLDVLAGKGYCWSVELNTKEAWRNCRGEYGQRGSDDPMYRLQMGQKMYDD